MLVSLSFAPAASGRKVQSDIRIDWSGYVLGWELNAALLSSSHGMQG
jgi:hypothetical protein